MELLIPSHSSKNTNFVTKNHANEYIEIHFSNPAFGKYAECKINKNFCDLVTDCCVKIKLPKLDHGLKWINDIGKFIIKKVIFKINNHTVEEFDFDYIHNHNSLTLPSNKKYLYDKLLSSSSNTLYIPLVFFFNKHLINDLPMVAINDDCIIGIEFEKIDKLVVNKNNNDLSKYEPINPTLLLNCIFLEHPAKEFLFKNPISRIVEVVNIQESDILNNDISHYTNTYKAYNYLNNSDIGIFRIKVLHNLIFQYLDYTQQPKIYNLEFDLNFNKPCKELWWAIVPIDPILALEDEPLKYVDMIQSAKITLNSYDRFQEQNSEFFTNYQQWIHHKNHVENLHVYSFNLNPESDCLGAFTNFGKFGSKKLHLTVLCPFDKFYKLKIYAIQYEHLKIESGHCSFDQNIVL